MIGQKNLLKYNRVGQKGASNAKTKNRSLKSAVYQFQIINKNLFAQHHDCIFNAK